MKKYLILTIAASSLFALSSFGDASEAWNQHCKKCHAEDGSGGTTIGKKLEIKDYTKAESLADFTDEDLFNMTKNGVAGTKMKGYGDKLSDDEIHALVTLMRGMAK